MILVEDLLYTNKEVQDTRLSRVASVFSHLTDHGHVLYIGANPRSPNHHLDSLVTGKCEVSILESYDGYCGWLREQDIGTVIHGDVNNRVWDDDQFSSVLWWEGPQYCSEQNLPHVLARLESAATDYVILGTVWWRDHPPGSTDTRNTHPDMSYAYMTPWHLSKLGYHVIVWMYPEREDDLYGLMLAWKRISPPKHDAKTITLIRDRRARGVRSLLDDYHGPCKKFIQVMNQIGVRSIVPLRFFEMVGNQGDHATTTYLMLYSLIASIRPRVILDIGTQAGRSALAMASALYDHKIDGHIISIDLPGPKSGLPLPHNRYHIDAVKRTKDAGLTDFITYVGEDTATALPRLVDELSSIDFAFIDEEKCNYARDFKMMHTKLKFAALHDIRHHTHDNTVREQYDQLRDEFADWHFFEPPCRDLSAAMVFATRKDDLWLGLL